MTANTPEPPERVALYWGEWPSIGWQITQAGEPGEIVGQLVYIRETPLTKAAGEMQALLKVAVCPNPGCGGQGYVARQVAAGEWEQEQCQWCYERQAVIAKAQGRTRGGGEVSEKSEWDLEEELSEARKENERLKNLTAGMFWAGGNFDDKTFGEVVALGLAVRAENAEQAKVIAGYRKLEAACREWKPIYESLGNDQPDDPITWALKELDGVAVACEHEWIDATNEVISHMDYCGKCGRVRSHSERLVESPALVTIATDRTNTPQKCRHCGGDVPCACWPSGYWKPDEPPEWLGKRSSSRDPEPVGEMGGEWWPAKLVEPERGSEQMNEKLHWDDIVAALTEMRGNIVKAAPGLLPMIDQALEELTELRKLRDRLVAFEPALKELDGVYGVAFVHGFKSSWPPDADTLGEIVARAKDLAK